MREIKFKAWDKDLKCFTDETVDWETLITLDGRMSPYPPKQNIVLMQYTGLKDKNGVEIYEGDIVNFYRASDVIGNYEVKFGEYQTELEYTLCWYAQGKTLAYAISEAMPCEVIGNIYENKELLEED